MKTLLLVPFFLITGFAAFSQCWETLSPTPTAADIYSASFINDSTGWISIKPTQEGNRLWRTYDRGVTWTPLWFDSLLPQASATIQFLDHANGWATLEGHLYKSTDGGSTWEEEGYGTASNTFYFLTAQNGYVSNADGSLSHTSDGGSGWTTWFPGYSSFEDLQFLTTNLGYAANFEDDSKSVLKTTNGSTWNKKMNIDNTYISDIFFINVDTGYAGGYVYNVQGDDPILYRTTDGGSNWQLVYAPEDYNGDHLVDIRAQGNHVLATTTAMKQVLSTDGGITFNEFYPSDSLQLPFVNEVNITNALAGEDDLFMVGNSGSIFRWGNDVAQSWSEVSRRVCWTNTHSGFGSSDTGWISSSAEGMFKTADGGITWSHVPSSPNANTFDVVNGNYIIAAGHPDSIQFFYRSTDGGNTWSTIFSTDQMNVILLQMVNEITGYCINVGGNLWKTTDGGSTWQFVYQTPNGEIADFKFISETEGWFITANEVYHSIDGGVTWSVQYMDISDGNFIRLDFSDADHGLVILSGNQLTHVIRTADGGDTWQDYDLDVLSDSLNDVALADSLDGWIAANKEILVTHDGGITWSPGFNTASSLTEVSYANNSGAFFTGPYGYLMRFGSCTEEVTDSSDISWTILSSPRTWNDFIASSFINDEEGWLIDDNAILWHTADGCATLDTVFTGKAFKKLHFVSTTIGYALDAAKVYRTTNGGITWSTLTMPGTFSPVFYFLNKDTGFVSGYAVYYKTEDGGNTWITLDMPSTTLWRDYWFTNDSTGFAVTEDYSNDIEIYRTIDCGLTWTPVGGNDESHLYSVWFAGEDTGWAAGYYDFGMQEYEIFKTVDAGLTWDVDFFEDAYGTDPLYDVRFKSDHKHGYVIGSDDNFMTYHGGGDYWFNTWDYDTLGLPWNVYNYQTALDGFKGLYLIGKYGTLLRWGKDTSQWTEVSGRLVSDAVDLSFTSATNGWLATGGAGILKTNDGGITWSKVPGPKFFTSMVEAVNDSLILAAGAHYWWPDQTIYRSTDGGQTWDSTYFIADAQFGSEMQMLDENNGYILSSGNGGPGRLYKTINGGLNWSFYQVGTGSDSQDKWTMFFLTANEGWLVYGRPSKNKIYHTTDGGITWTILYQYTGSDYQFTSAFFTDSLHGYLATTGSNYYESFDGGITWSAKIILGVSNYIRSFFADSLHGWFLTKYDIYETSNGGASWNNIYHSNTELYDFEISQESIFARGFYGFLIKGSHTCEPGETDFTSSAVNLSAQFTDSSSGAVSWSWDFGDGNSSSEQNPSHTYSEEGTYSVCLSITDSCGGNNSVCKSITVCEPLNTDYIFYQNNLEVHFSNLVNTADSSYWDFGDGVTSTLTSPTHDYDYAGTYTACLYEFDVCGDADTMCKDITVCGQLESNFSYSPNGNSVQFTDLSVHSEGRTWAFGDGFTDTLKNPTHIYDLPGDYNACIHSFNECETDSMCQLVSIIATSASSVQSDNFGFSIIPNPATNSFRIDAFASELCVRDQRGKLLTQVKNYHGEEISLTHFAGGSYTVEIKIDGNWYSRLLVKE